MSTATFPLANAAAFSLAHYEHMIQCGAFAGAYDKKVELIRGEIVDKGTGAPAQFTLDHYEHLAAVGAFNPPYNLPVELLQGELLLMSPIGEPHSLAVIALTEWSYEVVDRKRMMVRVQVPIRIPALQSEPEPDLVWARRKAPTEKPPQPEEVLLLVEVAESSLAYDRTVKLPVYAQAGIQEYWIVNLIDEQIEVHRQPRDDGYQVHTIHRNVDGVSPIAIPEAILQPANHFSH